MAALLAAVLTGPAELASAGGLTYVTSFGTLGSGSGQFNLPFGVAVSGGLVYVADQVNNRIDRFDPSNFAGTFTSFGTQGSGSGQFFNPVGVAVSGGLVYVADVDNQRIDRFDPNDFAASFTSFSGKFALPEGVAVSGGLVYVGDPGSDQLDRFDPSNFAGTFTSFGTFGHGPGQFFNPAGVAVDGSGNVFVADNGNNRIVQLATVPEPPLLVLLAAGGLAVLVARGMRCRAGRAA